MKNVALPAVLLGSCSVCVHAQQQIRPSARGAPAPRGAARRGQGGSRGAGSAAAAAAAGGAGGSNASGGSGGSSGGSGGSAARGIGRELRDRWFGRHRRLGRQHRRLGRQHRRLGQQGWRGRRQPRLGLARLPGTGVLRRDAGRVLHGLREGLHLHRHEPLHEQGGLHDQIQRRQQRRRRLQVRSPVPGSHPAQHEGGGLRLIRHRQLPELGARRAKAAPPPQPSRGVRDPVRAPRSDRVRECEIEGRPRRGRPCPHPPAVSLDHPLGRWPAPRRCLRTPPASAGAGTAGTACGRAPGRSPPRRRARNTCAAHRRRPSPARYGPAAA